MLIVNQIIKNSVYMLAAGQEFTDLFLEGEIDGRVCRFALDYPIAPTLKILERRQVIAEREQLACRLRVAKAQLVDRDNVYDLPEEALGAAEKTVAGEPDNLCEKVLSAFDKASIIPPWVLHHLQFDIESKRGVLDCKHKRLYTLQNAQSSEILENGDKILAQVPAFQNYYENSSLLTSRWCEYTHVTLEDEVQKKYCGERVFWPLSDRLQPCFQANAGLDMAAPAKTRHEMLNHGLAEGPAVMVCGTIEGVNTRIQVIFDDLPEAMQAVESLYMCDGSGPIVKLVSLLDSHDTPVLDSRGRPMAANPELTSYPNDRLRYRSEIMAPLITDSTRFASAVSMSGSFRPQDTYFIRSPGTGLDVPIPPSLINPPESWAHCRIKRDGDKAFKTRPLIGKLSPA